MTKNSAYTLSMNLCVLFLLLLISISCNQLDTPKIISSYPAENTSFVENRPLVYVEFSRSMDFEKTEAAFSLIGDSGTPGGEIAWNGNRLEYKLEDDLNTGERYTLKVDGSAEDTYGNKLTKLFMVPFYVGANRTAPTITSITPASGSLNITQNSIITIDFDMSMDRKSTEQAFSVSPSNEGIFAWSNNDKTLTFTPFENWALGQTYTATLATTAQNTNGITLKVQGKSVFRIGTDFVQPNLVSINTTGGQTVTDGETNIEKGDGFVFQFDEAMNTSDTESGIQVIESDTGASIAGKYYWSSAAYSTVTFQPDSLMNPGKTYRIKVTTTATDASGNPLVNPVDYSISINGANSSILTITDVRLNTGIGNCTFTSAVTVNPSGTLLFDLTSGTINEVVFDQGPLWTCPFEVTFSSAMDPGTFASNVSLTRVVGTGTGSGTIGCSTNACYNWDAPKTMVRIQVNDLGNQFGEFVYELRITGGNTGVKDTNGNWMDKDFILLFSARQ